MSKFSKRTAFDTKTDMSKGHIEGHARNKPLENRDEYNHDLPPRRQPVLSKEYIDFLRDEVSRENHALFNDLIA